MKNENREWFALIWKFTKAVMRLFFVVSSIVLAYTSVGLAKVAEFFESISNRLM